MSSHSYNSLNMSVNPEQLSTDEKVDYSEDTKSLLASKDTPVGVTSNPQSEISPAKLSSPSVVDQVSNKTLSKKSFESQQNEVASAHELPNENKTSVVALLSSLEKEAQSFTIAGPVNLDKLRRLNELTSAVINACKRVTDKSDSPVSCMGFILFPNLHCEKSRIGLVNVSKKVRSMELCK